MSATGAELGIPPAARLKKQSKYGLVGVLFLVGCGGQGPSPIPTPPPAPLSLPVSDVWALAPGAWIEYETVSGTGTWDPAACMIGRDPGLGGSQGVSRMTNLPYTLPNGAPAIARVWTPGGQPATAIPPGLEATLVEASDGRELGEGGNVFAAQIWPPEPLVTVHPQAGEELEIHSRVDWSTGGSLADFPTRYRTVATDVSLDGWDHATVTCLVEQPGEPGEVAYIQVFAGGELVEIWYGPPAVDGRVVLFYSKKVGSGLQ